MIELSLPDRNVWLRVVRPDYADPFDMSFAQSQGGRWNPPGSWPTLYLNEDMATVHAQVRHMFVGRGIDPDDLDNEAPLHLAACTLPRRQRVADAHTLAGLKQLSLPASYPVNRRGNPVGRGVTQSIGATAHATGLRGVWCTSAAGLGREVAWFPATGSAARPHWPTTKPFGDWRNARHLHTVSA
jgi:hypothetical protein